MTGMGGMPISGSMADARSSAATIKMHQDFEDESAVPAWYKTLKKNVRDWDLLCKLQSGKFKEKLHGMMGVAEMKRKRSVRLRNFAPNWKQFSRAKSEELFCKFA